MFFDGEGVDAYEEQVPQIYESMLYPSVYNCFFDF